MFINKTTRHPKVWGNELWLVNNEHYCGKILTIKKDFYCSFHAHLKKIEDFYVLKGRIQLDYQKGKLVDGNLVPIDMKRTLILTAGEGVHVPKGTFHRFYGCEQTNQIIETSTQHFEDDSYRLEESGTVF